MNRRTQLLILLVLLTTPFTVHAQDAASEVQKLERQWKLETAVEVCRISDQASR